MQSVRARAQRLVVDQLALPERPGHAAARHVDAQRVAVALRPDCEPLVLADQRPIEPDVSSACGAPKRPALSPCTIAEPSAFTATAGSPRIVRRPPIARSAPKLERSAVPSR